MHAVHNPPLYRQQLSSDSQPHTCPPCTCFLSAVLLPGLFAASIAESGAITATGFCPQGFVCPGGQPARVFDPSNPSALPASATTVQACPEGLWTKKVGSTSLSECLTPPGFYTADGQTKQCPPGSFRADWQPAGQATSCASCGQGVLADATDRVTKYPVGSTDPQEIAVSTSSQDCCKCAASRSTAGCLPDSGQQYQCCCSWPWLAGMLDVAHNLCPAAVARLL